MLELFGSLGRRAVADLLPRRECVEVPMYQVKESQCYCVWRGWRGWEEEQDVPERLGELEWFVHDALALFVVTHFGVSLPRDTLSDQPFQRMIEVEEGTHSQREVFSERVALESCIIVSLRF